MKGIKKSVLSMLIVALAIFSLSGCNKNCKHKDANNDGVCDKCKQSVVTTIDFYVINDLHGKFDDSSSQVGVDELTTYFKEKELVDVNVVLLSSGDMWQGSTESNQTHGKILIDWMNELGFVSQTMGNHEFDWGEEMIAENAEYAQFPFLAINVYDCDTDERVEYCEPSVMVEEGGIQIGIIGAIGDCYSSIASDRTKDIYFVEGAELTKLVEDEATKLREEGADFIVYSIHDGTDNSFESTKVIPDSRFSGYYDTVLSDGYVDLVFEAHTHQAYVCMDKYGVYHLQGGGENKGISHAEIEYNLVNNDYSVVETEVVNSGKYSSYSKDPLRDELLDKYSDILEETKKPLGTCSETWYSDDLRELVAQLYYEAGVERWGNDYDIACAGGFISVRNPYELSEGTVTYSTLQSLFPFDNELVLCSIKGSDINSVLFNNSNSNYAVYYEDYGEEVYNNIDKDATYYVIVDTYSSTYEPNNLTEIERYGADFYARDLLKQYALDGRFE